ncbi:glycosyltransferase family 4 protein [Desulfohalobiaceae bacterium Ax17]|uniref:glycosyltransferase family 4 protein n=1 Tax=Desulfovulcanus ferrireducens TaxID=2831190 RepID=UPI00207BBFC4|nr:glycosyltransferase family 4 protein [Desulfovulcanus ferrireducens]MBT8763931.1 glycosyltransferase family 4 protein [Desulfovulcanus ferrireducens]
MNVLHLDLGLEFRGGQRQVLYLACFQKQRTQVRPYLACPAKSPLKIKASELGIEILPLPSRQEFDPLNWIKLLSFLKRKNINIIHTHDARSAGLGAIVHRFFAHHVNLIHTRRVSYPLHNFWSVKKYVWAEIVVGVSREIANVMEGYGISPDKLEVIHSAIDTSLYSVRKNRTKDKINIGLIGALTEQKGHDVFFHALKELNSWPFNFVAQIAGVGPLKDRLEFMVKELDLTEKVNFLGYKESRELLPELDILVVPSISGEGSSAVIKEGWATRVPVVVSDLVSNLELVRDGINGLVFSRDNPLDLALCMQKLIKDEDLVQTITKNGFQEVKKYSVQAMGEKYLALYMAQGAGGNS